MIHVFNCPIDPSTLTEFQRARSPGEIEELFDEKPKSNKAVTYQKDGRRIVGGRVEDEQTPEKSWCTALKSSAILDWKKRCDNAEMTDRNDQTEDVDGNTDGNNKEISVVKECVETGNEVMHTPVENLKTA